MDSKRFPEIIESLYKLVAELEAMFPGRHFTPDGHLVGSIGEALAAYYYGIELAVASTQCHDGECDGRMVQVKATQGDRVAISCQPEHLLVLKLQRNGSFTEAYNGPGEPVWKLVAHKPRPKNGQYQVSLTQLRRVSSSQPNSYRLPRRPEA